MGRLMAMLPPVLVPHPHVEVSPDLLNGSPVIKGTRVPVRRLWAWHQRGVTVEILVKRYPSLGWARVLDALAFAFDNQALVDADLARETATLREEYEKYPPFESTQMGLPLGEKR